MSYTELVLQTKQVKEAIIEGAATWLVTGNFNEGWNAMIQQGRKNLAYPTFKIAILLDVLKVVCK